MVIPCQVQTNHLPASALNAINDLVDENIPGIFPAFTAAVMHRGELIFYAGYGWRDPEPHENPATVDTVFDLASVTKLFVETAFLTLLSGGKVDLDTPLVEVIPAFGEMNPRSMDGGQDPHSKAFLPTPEKYKDTLVDPTKVTFRHLLTHNSGLPAWRAVYEAAGVSPSPPDKIDAIPRQKRWERGLQAIVGYPFTGLPGKQTVYSDIGIMLLGESTARLHATSGGLERAVEECVTQPLNLPTMMYNPLQKGIERTQIAPTENDPTWRGRRCWGEVHDENACGVGGVAGHAGLFGTAVDIAKFGQAWLTKDDALGITDTIIQQATSEQVGSDGVYRFGFGWMLRASDDSSAGSVFHSDSFGHTGFTGTSLWIDPSRDLVVSTLTNRVYVGREKPGIHDFRRKYHDIIATATDSL